MKAGFCLTNPRRKQAESQMHALSVSRSNNSQSESLLFILQWFEIVWLSVQDIEKLHMIWRDIHFSYFIFLLGGGFKHFSRSPLLGEITFFKVFGCRVYKIFVFSIHGKKGRHPLLMPKSLLHSMPSSCFFSVIILLKTNVTTENHLNFFIANRWNFPAS